MIREAISNVYVDCDVMVGLPILYDLMWKRKLYLLSPQTVVFRLFSFLSTQLSLSQYPIYYLILFSIP